MSNTLFQHIYSLYGSSCDLKIRELTLDQHITIVSLDGIADDKIVVETVIKPLVMLNGQQTLDTIQQRLSISLTIDNVITRDVALTKFLNGYSLIFVEGEEGCLSADCRLAVGRTVAEPPTSMVLRGPREGFVENIKVNMALLRKRLKTPEFCTVQLSVGKYTNTTVNVCYINGVADSTVVGDIVQRIKNIKIDGVMDSSYISAYLDKYNTKLFRRVGTTEKPDIVTAKLLEGRVAILVDGSPMVLTLPYLFIEDLQSASDYHDGSIVASVSRILRYISVIVSVLLPAVYVSLQRFNYQIIPLKFLITILNATEAIPFSPLTEMLMVIVIFDILREANLRMPTAVGMSLSLVGAIVLGDAAVRAGLLGTPAVMIGALSGIGLFAMPENTLMLSFMRLAFAVVGGIMGLFGILISILMVVMYMVSMQDYSTPFLAPYAPIISEDKQDAITRVSISNMNSRPKSIPNENATRRDNEE